MVTLMVTEPVDAITEGVSASELEDHYSLEIGTSEGVHFVLDR